MRLAVALLLSLAATAPAHAAAPSGKVKVAVTDIKNVQGVAQGTATILSDIVVSEVARHGYAVISQSDIDAMLGFEKKKQMFGCAEETSCLAEIGGALGVEYLFTGQVGKIGSRFRISLMVVDARKAAVVARAAQFTDADEDALAKTSEEIVVQLLKEVAAIRQAMAAAAAQRLPEPAPVVAKVAPAPVPPPPPSAVVAKVAPPSPAVKGATPAVKAPPPAPPRAEPKPDLSARPLVASSSTPAVPDAPVDAEAARSRRNRGWWLVGGGGGLIVVGALAGLQAKSELAKLDDLWRLPADAYKKEYDSASGKAKTMALVADVCFVGGAAAAGWGTWMLLRKDSGAVAVAPMPIDGGAAVVAAGRF